MLATSSELATLVTKPGGKAHARVGRHAHPNDLRNCYLDERSVVIRVGGIKEVVTGLYQMMPLNARIGLKEMLKGFTGGPEIQVVDRKHDTDLLRFEPRTPGYALANFNAGYQWRHLRFEGGGTNLLNRCYDLPLGGVNLDDFRASGWMGQILPLTGPGRSFYVGMSVPF